MKRLIAGMAIVVLASLATTSAHAATVSFSRTTASPSAAAIAVGVGPTQVVNKYFLTTDADIISINQVTDRLNKSFGPFQIAPPNGSDNEPPTPEKLLANPAVEVDSWITTPGPTQRTVFGNQGAFPGGDTWFDTTNDGPQTNFQFALYTIPIDVNGFLEGTITLAGAAGPQTFPFSLQINFPFGIPEPSTLALVCLSLVTLVVRRRKPATVTASMKSSVLVLVVLTLPATAHAAKVYGVAVAGTTQSLVTWDSGAPGVILSTSVISGLPANEAIRGMDFEPVYFFPGDQRIYAIGAGSDQFANVYSVNPFTGVAAKQPDHFSSPRANAEGQFYGVSSFGSGSLRSVSDASRLAGYDTATNSGSGIGVLFYAPGDVNANMTPHAVHFFSDSAVDTELDVLAVRTGNGPVNSLSTVGPLGADFDDAGAIDLDDPTGILFASLLPAGQTQSSFYTLNQQTGATTLIGPIGNGLLITAMAVEPPLRNVPEPSTALLLALGLVACVRLRSVWRLA